ncbi:MAG: outer membrane protein assembly factor BamD [Desulfobacterales bacterium]|nr:outer membrane protein assembly factor BamD [Desulfobacterales bacterium]MBT7695949.1 outer membrane protein assembly factor BamD [Desulfobacterales bacterium]
MKRIITLLLFVLSFTIIFTGCASLDPEEKSVEEFVEEGMKEFNGGDYVGAIVVFEKLKDWYPFSKYAILAELKIADSYFHGNKYEDAIFAYEDFERLHPRNEAIEYVIFQIGYCHFIQLDTPDRDQDSARNAIKVFSRLITQFPETDYLSRAKEYIEVSKKSLTENEFYIGMYYFKRKHYKAALNRFQLVVKNHPDSNVHQKALQYISLCEELIKKEVPEEKEE